MAYGDKPYRECHSYDLDGNSISKPKVRIYATEYEACAIAELMNSLLEDDEKNRGAWIARIQPSGKGWKIHWLTY